jgi:hypothetical protein
MNNGMKTQSTLVTALAPQIARKKKFGINEGGRKMKAQYRRIILAVVLIVAGGWTGFWRIPQVQGQIPKGSYKQTCFAINVKGKTLTALCKKINGDVQFTELKDIHLCVGNVSNKNGNLRCDKGGLPPEGSYDQTCMDIRVENNILYAACRTRAGIYLPTSLADHKNCVGPVANLDGNLRCNKGGTPPSGSYRQSCRDLWVDGDTLHSQCKDRDGNWRNAALKDFKACRSAVYNMEGYLTCVRGNANPPAGSYDESCRNINVNGTSLAADCRTISGSWQHASLSSFDGCRSAVRNIDGYLTCDRGTANAPAGSYRKTCRSIVVDGTTLEAICRTKNGDWKSRSLQFDECQGDISNQDGILDCTKSTKPNKSGVSLHMGTSEPTVKEITYVKFHLKGPNGYEEDVFPERNLPKDWNKVIEFDKPRWGDWEVTVTVHFKYSNETIPKGDGNLEQRFEKKWEITKHDLWRFCIVYHGYGNGPPPYTVSKC